MKVFIDADGGSRYCFTHMLFCKNGETTTYLKHPICEGDELHIVIPDSNTSLEEIEGVMYHAANVAVPIFFHSEYAITCKECAKTSFRPKSSKALVEEIDHGWAEL